MQLKTCKKVAVRAMVVLGAAAVFAGSPALAATGACAGFKLDVTKDFVQNFNNPCFAVPMNTGGGADLAGDSSATYDQITYQIMPGYELIVLGSYPNGRFFSATAYDDHMAVTSRLLDYQIQPLLPGMVNPFIPGNTYQAGSTWGLTVGFGQPLGTVAAGCQTSDTTIDQNFLDASQIHQGLTWLGYPNLPPNFPMHETGANVSGIITIRRYLDMANVPGSVVIVRQLSNGCAITANQALQMKILGLNQGFFSTWLHQDQIADHQQFVKTIVPEECYPSDPQNKVRFFRSWDYIPLANAGANIDGNLNSTTINALTSGQFFMRIRFVLPTTPNIPCTTGLCTLTGNEQLRYYSLSFQAPPTLQGGPSTTLISFNDTAFTTDAFGNVTVLVNMGAGVTQPPVATPANGYTYIDLTQVKNYATLNKLEIRNLLPGTGFNCSTFSPPFYTMEYNPVGGFMGAYVPTVDFPTASELNPNPAPPVRSDTCTLVPPPPTACQVQL